MRWIISSLRVKSLLLATTVGASIPPSFIPRYGSSVTCRIATLRRSRMGLTCLSNPGLLQHRRIMLAAAESWDDSYQWSMWKRRARRSMKYVSMPIISIPGQPREQVRCSCDFRHRGVEALRSIRHRPCCREGDSPTIAEPPRRQRICSQRWRDEHSSPLHIPG